MATKLEGEGGGGKALVAGSLKKTFFIVSSLRVYKHGYGSGFGLKKAYTRILYFVGTDPKHI